MASSSSDVVVEHLRLPQHRHDPSITFEEYLYYASVSRDREAKLSSASVVFDGNPWDFLRQRFVGSISPPVLSGEDLSQDEASDDQQREKTHQKEPREVAREASAAVSPVSTPSEHGVSHAEWLRLSRATRNTSWSVVFYLITTDMFGPLSIPWTFSRLGYGPGTVIYTVFGALAGYTGYQLWAMYIHLDSDRYPLRNYGDLAFRIFGGWARHVVNILQSFQLFFDVALLTLASGQGIAQLARGSICFIVCIFVFCCAGCILGQIRTLRTFGWLANFSIILNVLILCITMGVAANSPPNYAAAEAQSGVQPGPVVTSAGLPSQEPFEYQMIGLMQAVYSYAAAMMFCEFMSEMRRPWDFWKGMLCAQIFIYCSYLFYGLFIYSYQGQFVVLISNQGLSPFVWQSITNGMGLVSALILACLYGNIGIKVLYSNIGMDLLNFPDLATGRGKWIFAATVPIYWVLAFVVGSAVPSITNFGSLISAICVIQFSYTFPPVLMLGFNIQKNAALPEEAFNPLTGEVARVDRGLKRWMRGMGKSWPLNLWNFVFALGAATTAVLGIYASVVELIDVFKYSSAVTSFGCTNPVGA